MISSKSLHPCWRSFNIFFTPQTKIAELLLQNTILFFFFFFFKFHLPYRRLSTTSEYFILSITTCISSYVHFPVHCCRFLNIHFLILDRWSSIFPSSIIRNVLYCSLRTICSKCGVFFLAYNCRQLLLTVCLL